MSEQIKRAAATQQTFSMWNGKRFKWGKADCAKLAIYHLRAMGHQPKIKGLGDWRTPDTAAEALERVGWKDLVDAVDAQGFDPIIPAFARIGDIAVIEADFPHGCLVVCVGPDQWLGLHEDAEGFTVLNVMQFMKAWRVPCEGEIDGQSA